MPQKPIAKPRKEYAVLRWKGKKIKLIKQLPTPATRRDSREMQIGIILQPILKRESVGGEMKGIRTPAQLLEYANKLAEIIAKRKGMGWITLPKSQAILRMEEAEEYLKCIRIAASRLKKLQG